MNNKAIIGGVVAVVVLLCFYFFFSKNKKSTMKKADTMEETPVGTIYGVMTCPHTVKQVEKFPGYKFVDCSTNTCPEIVKAYPTSVHADGRVEIGTAP